MFRLFIVIGLVVFVLFCSVAVASESSIDSQPSNGIRDAGVAVGTSTLTVAGIDKVKERLKSGNENQRSPEVEALQKEVNKHRRVLRSIENLLIRKFPQDYAMKDTNG